MILNHVPNEKKLNVFNTLFLVVVKYVVKVYDLLFFLSIFAG